MNQLIKAQPTDDGKGYVANATVIYDNEDKVVAVIFDVENNKWISDVHTAF